MNMHYDDQNYRLPTEARTPMLQVSHGCSYNKCNYCSLYYKTPFAMSSFDEITEDIKYISSKTTNLERIYLMNGDPFTLPTDRLIKIMDEVKKYIPSIKSFSMFASVLNVQKKTDEELKILRDKGVTDLYMGSESFHDPTLDLAGVGYNAQESLKAIKRLEKADIGYSVMMILGLGGSKGEDTAKEIGTINGRYMSQISPINITITNLFIPNNSVYGKMRREGKFKPATEREKTLEQKYLFEKLKSDANSFYYSFHDVSTRDLHEFLKISKDRQAFASLYSYYNMQGNLHQDKKKAIEITDQALESLHKYPGLNHYPWFDYKKKRFQRSDILSANDLLKPRDP